MPQRKPSPPESADIAGMAFATAESDGDVALFPQQITSCFPLASMEQKTSSFPNDAEIGPIEPNPCALPNRKRNKRRRKKEEKERAVRICMVGLGTWEQCHSWIWWRRWFCLCFLFFTKWEPCEWVSEWWWRWNHVGVAIFTASISTVTTSMYRTWLSYFRLSFTVSFCYWCFFFNLILLNSINDHFLYLFIVWGNLMTNFIRTRINYHSWSANYLLYFTILFCWFPKIKLSLFLKNTVDLKVKNCKFRVDLGFMLNFRFN